MGHAEETSMKPLAARKELVSMVAVAAIWVGLQMGAAAQQAPKAQLTVSPQRITLSAQLLKEPPSFKGSGFKPGESVTIDLVIPKGVKIKTVPEAESSVGVAFGKANEKGEFEAKMAPTAIFNWLLQVDWTTEGKPDLTKATPLPPGVYELRAAGMESDAVATATMEVTHPTNQ